MGVEVRRPVVGAWGCRDQGGQAARLWCLGDWELAAQGGAGFGFSALPVRQRTRAALASATLVSKLPVRQRTRGGARHRAGILSKLPVRQRTAIPGPPACLNISKLPVRQRTVPRSSSWPTIFSKLPAAANLFLFLLLFLLLSAACAAANGLDCWMVFTHFLLPVRQRTRRAHSLASGIFLLPVRQRTRSSTSCWIWSFSAACAAANRRRPHPHRRMPF